MDAAAYADYRQFGQSAPVQIERRLRMTQDIINHPPAEAPKKRQAVRWQLKSVAIEKDLGGQLLPHDGGIAWIPGPGYRLDSLERDAGRAFYALVKPEGGCDIVVANAAGLRKALLSEIPPSVISKSLEYSLGGSFDGEIVMPVRTGDGFRPVTKEPGLKADDRYQREMEAYMKHAGPDEY